MYRIRLEQFEGPLDLLLFFIRRDEIDIYDIPIAEIADEFLAYVRLLEKVDLDGVGDFIFMAALLMSIKARMLLPQPETDDEGEPVDPRRELVERLLEYVRFKEAAGQLEERAARRAERFTRAEAAAEREAAEEAHDPEVEATVFDLARALGRLLAEAEEEERPVHAVERESYAVEDQQDYVLERVASGAPVAFAELVRRRSKAFVIATFLAVLELARQRHLVLTMAEAGAGFFLTARPGPLSAGDGAAAPTPPATA